MDKTKTILLLIQADDRVGIVSEVTSFLAARDGFILDSQQYADTDTGRFFMRVEFTSGGPMFPSSLETIREDFAAAVDGRGMEWTIAPSDLRLKTMIAVSKGGHCLNDLLYRWSTGDMPIDITGVIGNHETLRHMVEGYNLPFHYFPVTNDTRAAQEHAILDLIDRTSTEMLVLARYMQVLSDDMSRSLSGKCINIHHSFLPAFKGAQPYHRAFERGVKLIGATAHFVTGDLDEGPIIEQAVEPVDHRATADVMVRIGRHTEARVLSRAIRAAAERRIFLNGKKTVVFR